jgi:hypothetical protein
MAKTKVISIPTFQCPVCLDPVVALIENPKEVTFSHYPSENECPEMNMRLVKRISDFEVEI